MTSTTPESAHDAQQLADDLAARGVAGVTIHWADNNGIPRSRTVPVAELPRVAEIGVGITTLFAVFDSHDAITYAHEPLSTPSGDVRLVPVLEALTPLAGQPALAWVPGRQVAADGSPWPYDQRGVLERQVAALAEQGLSALVGYEMEFTVTGGDFEPAHPGPAYSPHALVPVDAFVADVLRDCAANGVALGQLHAEYGPAQMELSIAAADPVTAADRQLLVRQTLRAAAHHHGLQLSFAPLPALEHRRATAGTSTPPSGATGRTCWPAAPAARRGAAARRDAARPGRASPPSPRPASARSSDCGRATSPARTRSGAWRTGRRRSATSRARRCSAPGTRTSS